VEVLFNEFAATLPAPLAARLRAADSPGTTIDWMFAGAVYRAVADDPFLAAQFLARIETNPREAGMAMASALASKQEPPPRDAAWHRRDRLGLTLQLGVAALVLIGRFMLFMALAALIQPPMTPITPSTVLPVMLGLDLFQAARDGGLANSPWLALAVVWVGVEALAVPHLLEFLRQLPARLQRNPPPLSWRIDTFFVLWYMQAMIPLLIVEAALFLAMGRMAIMETPSLIQSATLIGLGLTGAAALGLALGLARSTLRLGTVGSGPRSC
jgi:hypothetical protein